MYSIWEYLFHPPINSSSHLHFCLGLGLVRWWTKRPRPWKCSPTLLHPWYGRRVSIYLTHALQKLSLSVYLYTNSGLTPSFFKSFHSMAVTNAFCSSDDIHWWYLLIVSFSFLFFWVNRSGIKAMSCRKAMFTRQLFRSWIYFVSVEYPWWTSRYTEQCHFMTYLIL